MHLNIQIYANTLKERVERPNVPHFYGYGVPGMCCVIGKSSLPKGTFSICNILQSPLAVAVVISFELICCGSVAVIVSS